jgi:hypothetical protein
MHVEVRILGFYRIAVAGDLEGAAVLRDIRPRPSLPVSECPRRWHQRDRRPCAHRLRQGPPEDILGADLGIIETVAHAKSALDVFPEADVICDVMILRQGSVADFRLSRGTDEADRVCLVELEAKQAVETSEMVHVHVRDEHMGDARDLARGRAASDRLCQTAARGVQSGSPGKGLDRRTTHSPTLAAQDRSR